MSKALFALTVVAMTATAAVCVVEDDEDLAAAPTDTSTVEPPTVIPDVPEEALEPPQPSPPPDPYAGHENWCEELQPPPCATNDDCTPSKTGADRRCIQPYGYEPEPGDVMGLCVPVYLGWTPK